MSDLDTRLAAALKTGEAPTRDAVFRVEVLMRLEQARFRRQVQRTMVVAMLVAVLALMSAPDIDAWVAADAQRWVVVLGAAAALCVISLMLVVPRCRSVASRVSRLPYP